MSQAGKVYKPRYLGSSPHYNLLLLDQKESVITPVIGSLGQPPSPPLDTLWTTTTSRNIRLEARRLCNYHVHDVMFFFGGCDIFFPRCVWQTRDHQPSSYLYQVTNDICTDFRSCREYGAVYRSIRTFSCSCLAHMTHLEFPSEEMI